MSESEETKSINLSQRQIRALLLLLNMHINKKRKEGARNEKYADKHLFYDELRIKICTDAGLDPSVKARKQ